MLCVIRSKGTIHCVVVDQGVPPPHRDETVWNCWDSQMAQTKWHFPAEWVVRDHDTNTCSIPSLHKGRIRPTKYKTIKQPSTQQQILTNLPSPNRPTVCLVRAHGQDYLQGTTPTPLGPDRWSHVPFAHGKTALLSDTLPPWQQVWLLTSVAQTQTLGC